jgi:hypothetical protein
MAKARKYEVQMFPSADNNCKWSAKLAPYYDLADFSSVFGRMEEVLKRHGASIIRNGRSWKLTFLRAPKRLQLESITSDIRAAWHGLEHVKFIVLTPPGYLSATKAVAARMSKTEVQALSHTRFQHRLHAVPTRKQKQKELLWWLEGVAARTNLPISDIMKAMDGVVR